ncbi:hypothetical protein EON83_02820 [bacterium]|nr:MAG: hypothetical protein EON83_02820 [bacterium]
MKQKIVVFVGLACTVGCFAYVYGRQNKVDVQGEIESAGLAQKTTIDSELFEPIFGSYSKVATGDSNIKKAVQIAWNDARKGNYAVFLALLAVQNQQLIEQNQRMISLMEKKK